MATIKITNNALSLFRSAAQNYINMNPDRTRLHYALEKMLKKTLSLFEDYADKENEIRIDCALIDEKTKVFIMSDDKKQLLIDPSKSKDLQKRTRALGREIVEFETYYATEVPKELEAMWYQQFTGIVIKDEDDNMAIAPLTGGKTELKTEDVTE